MPPCLSLPQRGGTGIFFGGLGVFDGANLSLGFGDFGGDFGISFGFLFVVRLLVNGLTLLLPQHQHQSRKESQLPPALVRNPVG
jgi:hypothetical protein